LADEEAKPAESPGFVEDIGRVPLPRRKEGEMFAIADQLLGACKIKVMCADGKTRMARIPGKMKKRMWIREGDLVIIRPWKFQDEKSDVVWRYTKTQASYLSRRKLLPKEIDIF
jgi:translation initiation factor 1A